MHITVYTYLVSTTLAGIGVLMLFAALQISVTDGPWGLAVKD